MKRLHLMGIIILLTICLLGCDSKTSGNTVSQTDGSNNTQDTQTQPSSPNDSQGDQSAGSDEDAVSLVEDWPAEVPLMKGKITASLKGKESKFVDGKMVPTGKDQYSTAIQYSGTAKDAADYYKSKFSEITDQGIADESNAACSGVIGGWMVSITAGATSSGVSDVTIIATQR